MSQRNSDDMSDEDLVRQLHLEYPQYVFHNTSSASRRAASTDSPHSINWSVECREEAPPLPSPQPTEPATTSSATATAASSPASLDDDHSAACADCTCTHDAEPALERNHNTTPAAGSAPEPPEFIYPAPPGSNFAQLPPHARDFYTYLPGTVSPTVYREMLRYVLPMTPTSLLSFPSPDVAPPLTSHSVMPPEAAARAAETRAAFDRFRNDPLAPAFLRHNHTQVRGDDEEIEEVVDEVWGESMTVPRGYRRTQTGSRRRRPQRWRPLKAVEGEGEKGEEGVEEKKVEKRGRKRKITRSAS
ncbi:hypothetical protein SLS56_011283 [Neofusicoccum ribis]|uniref:Uncharacterized protein n=1 Tax=Neofusicoccum ribis TaxID=45134 RepID=A0ABR3SC27_9PEZI